MPIYEYKCNDNNCETDNYELIQGFNESTGICPECKYKVCESKNIMSFFYHELKNHINRDSLSDWFDIMHKKYKYNLI